MKKTAFIVAIVMLFVATSAYAASPVGSWSGTGSIFGFFSGPCSATFSQDGTVSMASKEYSVDGTWSDGVISVNNGDDHIKVRYSIDGQTMTMSVSYGGYSANATLYRNGGDSSSESSAAKSTVRTCNGIWENEKGYVVRIYEGGFFHYTWTEEDENGEVVTRDFICELSESEEDSAKLVLTPFEKLQEEDEEIQPILVSYKVSKDTLTLRYDGKKYTYTFKEEADAKPESDLFIPYVELVRGDKGQAVRRLQEQLTQANCLNDVIDGIYGSKTEAAVLLYEQSVGLVEDGIADSQVRAQLLEAYPIIEQSES